MVAVMFKIQFSILDYCLGPVPEFCLPGVALIPCFKVVLTVALWLCDQTIFTVVLLTM